MTNSLAIPNVRVKTMVLALFLVFVCQMRSSSAQLTPVEEIFFEVSTAQPKIIFTGEVYLEYIQRLSTLETDTVPDLIEVAQQMPLRSVELSLAFDALCETRDPRAIPIVVDVLSAPNFLGHMGTNCQWISKFGDEIVPALVKLADERDSSSEPYYRAVVCLVEINSPEAKKYCSRAIEERNRRLIDVSIDYLVSNNDPSFRTQLIEILEEASAETGEEPGEVKSHDYDTISIHTAAIRGLGKIGPSQASSPVLLKILADPTSLMHKEAIRAVGKIQDQEAIPTLLKFLSDPPIAPPQVISGSDVCMSAPPQPTRRELVISALAQFGPKAEDQLIKLTDSDDIHARSGAIVALAEMGSLKSQGLLEKVLADRNDSTRMVAAIGLGKLAKPSSVEVLIEAIDETTAYGLNSILVKALVAIGDPARPLLLKKLNDENYLVRTVAIEALSQLAREGDFPALATEVAKPRNDGLVALQQFFDMAKTHWSPEIEETCWKRTDYSFDILAARKDTDLSRLQQEWLKLTGKAQHGSSLSRLVPHASKVWCEEVETEIVRQCLLQDWYCSAGAFKMLADNNLALMLQQIKSDPKNFELAFEALKQHGEKPEVQSYAIESLENPALIKQSLDLISKAKMKTAGDAVLEIYQSPDQISYRNDALNTLSEIKGKRLIGEILKLSQSEVISPFVKKTLDAPKRQDFNTVTKLAEMGDEDGLRLLTSKFLKPRGYSEHIVWQTIARCPRKTAQPYLQKLLTSSKYEFDSISYFERMGTEAAIKVLRDHIPKASKEGKARILDAFKNLGIKPN